MGKDRVIFRTVCCVCHVVKSEREIDRPDGCADAVIISHGYCASCAQKAIEKYFGELNAKGDR